ncbi:DMT family transporter [Saccharopolyspora hirsuta]|uniref:DMT family transporter n=1 Tax=Saccharopolyspora hirsuta TaxID=1837 RepID=A0A5M7BXD1_SACHI|nr:DMT family transporter [Saccharopolyspora hirsuta]KAA5834452.1 DMT family transporter [Saccharopolyspora hirsuta]
MLRTAGRSPTSPSASRPGAGTAVGALFIATSGVWVSLSGTSPGTASVYRCALALPFLALLALREPRSEAPQHGLSLAAGVLFSADMLLWTQAIAEVGAGLSAVIVNLQVVLVPALAWLVDREPVTRRYLLAVPVVLLGVALTSGVLDGGGTGADPVLGTVHASLAALCYSGFLFLLRRSGRRGPTARSYLAMMTTAALVSLPLGALWHGIDLFPGWAAIGWLLLVAVCGQVLGWLLVAASLPHLSSQVGAILLLLTPVGALALGAAVLGERPTPLQLLGCALVLGSVVAVAGRRES